MPKEIRAGQPRLVFVSRFTSGSFSLAIIARARLGPGDVDKLDTWRHRAKVLHGCDIFRGMVLGPRSRSVFMSWPCA